MRHFFALLARSKRGATAIEYGLIAALIAVACMTAINSVAENTIGMWGYVKTNIVPKEE
ncbi:MAG: Flp family type IVb pilin [Blastomonas sp.]|nr:Flp family type IVb pilin [Blastomonas sp.]